MSKNIDNIRILPTWEKSRDNIWNDCFEGFPEELTTTKNRPMRWRPFLAAAVLALVFILPSAAYFYTSEIEVPKGTHATVYLPDGSFVVLNAESKLSYKPLWWYVSRNVYLQGESYFDVIRGGRFTVNTTVGSVTVLGTTFNVLARGEAMDVVCLTGKVGVAVAGEQVVLLPNSKVQFLGKSMVVSSLPDATAAIGWTQDRFVFTNAPLSEVLAEVERQYNIEIVAPENIDYLFTGNFKKTDDLKQVLRIIEKPFGIELSVK